MFSTFRLLFDLERSINCDKGLLVLVVMTSSSVFSYAFGVVVNAVDRVAFSRVFLLSTDFLMCQLLLIANREEGKGTKKKAMM